jgi:hypothetical protein
MCYEFCERGLYCNDFKQKLNEKRGWKIFKNNLLHKDEIYYAYKYIYIYEK